ncbi:MAG: hypothetical protein OIN84_12750, partial [Candidatus Methanoperedens sp.]|nr:hypothetical protein [Candidatus Methanoperedens sp.]
CRQGLEVPWLTHSDKPAGSRLKVTQIVISATFRWLFSISRMAFSIRRDELKPYLDAYGPFANRPYRCATSC